MDHGNGHRTLRSGSISLIGLIALSMGMTSPALGLYSLWGPIQLATGPVAPLVFLLASVVALPTAISYSVLNREAPSAGAASTWLWKTLSPDIGFLVGLTMSTYFFIAIILQPIMFGLFFADLLRFFGFSDLGISTIIIGSLAGTIPAVVITYRGAEVSSKSAIFMMAVEIGVVLSLCVTILAVKGPVHGVTLAPFNPSNIVGGMSAFWGSTLLGILGFCGFDVVSTAAEEANAPRDAIPTAIIWTIIASAVFWIVTSWILTLSVPVASVRGYVDAGITPVTPIAHLYWGRGSILVTLTGMTSALVVYIASVMGLSRMVFAMARHRLLPGKLSIIHPEFRVPWNAMHLIYVAAVACVVGSLAYMGNGIEAFTWWANAVVFFALLTFIAVNVANLLFFRVCPGTRPAFLKSVLMPVFGVAVNVYVIYEAFFRSLWKQGFRSGQSVIIFSVAVFALLILVVGLTRLFRPACLSGEAPLEVES
jgi:amino acid transporter